MKRMKMHPVIEPEKYGEELLPHSFRAALAHLLCCLPMVALVLLFGICACLGGWKSHLTFLPEQRSDVKKEREAPRKLRRPPSVDAWHREVYIRALHDLGVDLSE